MDKGIIFWIIMIVGLLFGAWSSWPFQKSSGINLVVFILLALLGWQVFGAAVK